MTLISRLVAIAPPVFTSSTGRRQLLGAVLGTAVLAGTFGESDAARRKHRATGKVQAAKKKRCKGRKCRRCPKGTVFIGGKGRRSVGWCASVARELSTSTYSDVSAVAVAKDGSMYVLDAGLNRIDHYAANGNILQVISGAGDLPGQFNKPIAITLDQDDNVYVLETNNGRVQKLSPTLTNPTVLVSGLPVASGIAYQAPGFLYVSCRGHLGMGVVKKYLRSGTPLLSTNGDIGQPIAIATRVNQPGLIVVDRADRELRSFSVELETTGTSAAPELGDMTSVVDTPRGALVTDTTNNRLALYRPNGTPLFFGSTGSAVGAFDSPRGLTVGPDGAVYVVDAGNDRIIKLMPAK